MVWKHHAPSKSRVEFVRRSFNQISQRLKDIFQFSHIRLLMCAVWNAHAPVFHQFLPVRIRFIKSSPLPSVASQESAEPAESMIVTVALVPPCNKHQQPVELNFNSCRHSMTHRIVPHNVVFGVSVCGILFC